MVKFELNVPKNWNNNLLFDPIQLFNIFLLKIFFLSCLPLFQEGTSSKFLEVMSYGFYTELMNTVRFCAHAHSYTDLQLCKTI